MKRLALCVACIFGLTVLGVSFFMPLMAEDKPPAEDPNNPKVWKCPKHGMDFTRPDAKGWIFVAQKQINEQYNQPNTIPSKDTIVFILNKWPGEKAGEGSWQIQVMCTTYSHDIGFKTEDGKEINGGETKRIAEWRQESTKKQFVDVKEQKKLHEVNYLFSQKPFKCHEFSIAGLWKVDSSQMPIYVRYIFWKENKRTYEFSIMAWSASEKKEEQNIAAMIKGIKVYKPPK